MTPIKTAEMLAHAIAVYGAKIESDDHNQCREFHRRVNADAIWTLAKHRGEPCNIEPTGHARPTLNRALREVYSELAIMFYHTGRSGLGARRKAASALGIEYRDYVKVIRSRAP